jgi:hypothetical protein
MAFIERFDSYACDGESIACAVDGFAITARIERDSDCGTPWENSDGHGAVTDWERRDKAPGELILAGSRGDSCRFYDFAGAVALAKRDAWGVAGGRQPRETAAQYAARAAMADYESLKEWCDDEWHYIGIVLSASRNGIALDDCAASLWGIECNYPGSDNAYLSEVAAELLPEALTVARAALASLCDCEGAAA